MIEQRIKKTTRQKVFDKYGGLCAYTGKPLGDDWQVDHAIPKYHYTVLGKAELKDQINHIDNLLPAIKIINHYKRGLSVEGFRSYMMDFHKRLSRLPKNTVVKRTEKRKEYMHAVASLFDITPDKPFSGKFYFEKVCFMTEAEKEARKIMKRQLHHISGVPEIYILIFHKGDGHVETARKCSIEVAKEMQREHSCETLNNERWRFWSDVEAAIKAI